MKRLLQIVLAVTMVSVLWAQEPTKVRDTPKDTGQRIFKVSFNIYELEDGKRINERTYTLPVNALDNKARGGSIKVGTRVPITTKENQVQYMDVGLSIDCDVVEQMDKLLLGSSIEISSFAVPDQNVDPRSGGNPILRTIRTHFTTLVSPGKPTLAASIDDTNSKKRLQVEVTVTRVE